MSVSCVKLQTIIPNSNIVVDNWDHIKKKDRPFRFMTSIKNHSVKSISSMRKCKYPIYTSLFNKWYLHHFYKITEDRIIVLEYDQTIKITDDDKNTKFSVTAIEANYCPGSTMFLFEGPFGNILYTGYFRSSVSVPIADSPAFKRLIDKKNLHKAYIDNSYAAEHCTFPTRKEAIEKIIQFIRNSQSCKIIISSNPLGKEEALLAIASKLDVKIGVSQERFGIFEKMGVSDFFIENGKETRISTVDHLLNSKECVKIFKDDRSCIIILLTALYEYGPKEFVCKSKFPRLHIVPYSGHCNHAELKQFVAALQPRAIFPIVKPRTITPCSVIPPSIYNLCGGGDEARDDCSDKCSQPSNRNHLPIVLIPRLPQVIDIRKLSASVCEVASVLQPTTDTFEATQVLVPTPNVTKYSTPASVDVNGQSRLVRSNAESSAESFTTAEENCDDGESDQYSVNEEIIENFVEDVLLSPKDCSEELFYSSDYSVNQLVVEVHNSSDDKGDFNVYENYTVSEENVDAPLDPIDSSTEDALPLLELQSNRESCNENDVIEEFAVEEPNVIDNDTEIPTSLRFRSRVPCRVSFALPTDFEKPKSHNVENAASNFQPHHLEITIPSGSSSPSLVHYPTKETEIIPPMSQASDSVMKVASSKSSHSQVSSSDEQLITGSLEEVFFMTAPSDGMSKRMRQENEEPQENGESSDFEDCLIVAEYKRNTSGDNFLNYGEQKPKKLKLDSVCGNVRGKLHRRNDNFVNAILFHYSKLYDKETSASVFSQCSYFNKCNIFSHSPYKI